MVGLLACNQRIGVRILVAAHLNHYKPALSKQFKP